MEQAAPGDLEAVIERARARAARTGELRPGPSGSFERSVPDELAEFVDRILTDGSYAREVDRIGREDPDLASI
jgi:hypothetical protein